MVYKLYESLEIPEISRDFSFITSIIPLSPFDRFEDAGWADLSLNQQYKLVLN